MRGDTTPNIMLCHCILVKTRNKTLAILKPLPYEKEDFKLSPYRKADIGNTRLIEDIVLLRFQ